jgi:putative hydrolase of the HAD superfamily
LTLGLASNFDSRLHNVAAGRAELARLGPIVVSAEVGWRKPAPQFFAAAVAAFGSSPRELLFVGDDYENDYAGATAAGLRAVYVGAPRSGVVSVPNLSQLLNR